MGRGRTPSCAHLRQRAALQRHPAVAEQDVAGGHAVEQLDADLGMRAVDGAACDPGGFVNIGDHHLEQLVRARDADFVVTLGAHATSPIPRWLRTIWTSSQSMWYVARCNSCAASRSAPSAWNTKSARSRPAPSPEVSAMVSKPPVVPALRPLVIDSCTGACANASAMSPLRPSTRS